MKKKLFALAALVAALGSAAGTASAQDVLARVGDLARCRPLRCAVAELDHCAAYTGHAYTDFTSSGTLPRYVGTPERGGYWVEARDYDRTLAEYNERIRREDEERRRQSWLN
uniref:TrbM/KikA/MpfK family conjugal transfer protein n=1 Tax=Xanthomonas oryzae TaxID=347 RepID=UPI003DA15D10